jgi:threonine/homoserine/homoserine lactone efflux protein
VIGWVVGLSVVGSVALFIGGTQDLSPGTEPSTAASVIRLILGFVLLFGAYRRWTRRPKPRQQPAMPHWLQFVDSFKPMRAFGLALLLSAINPKNLALTLAAALDIAQSTLGNIGSAIALVIFVVIASISVAAPVVLYLISGERAERTLNEWKAWLIENNATLISVLLLVLGVIVIGEGINGFV